MAAEKLDKPRWRSFFDGISDVVLGKRAEVEIASLNLGSQIEAEWLPLLGITYDHKNDLIEIALDGLDHMVHRPREVYVDVGPGGLTSLELVDADGVQQIVRLREPLMLPPASSAGDDRPARKGLRR